MCCIAMRRGHGSQLLVVLAAAWLQLALADDAQRPAGAAAGQSVHIVTTACGAEAAEDIIVLLKSCALHADPANKYFIHVFMSNHTEFPFIQGHPRRSEFEAAHVDISFHAIKAQNHSDLFRPCSTNRLYAAELLPDVDAIIYLDADTLVTTDLAQLWRHFAHFTEAQEVAATREGFQCGEPSTWKNWYETCGGFKGWYPTGFFDFVAPTGVNAGVLLMNLTRLRASNAVAEWEVIMANRTSVLYMGDQDVLNIHYNKSIERLYILPCRWNIRTDTFARCRTTAAQGRYHDVPAEDDLEWERRAAFERPLRPGVLHGSRGVFRDEKGWGKYAQRVMAFDLANRGNQELLLEMAPWPGG